MADEPIELTSSQVVEIAGCSYRQLDFWSRCGYLHPDGTPGSGHNRRWSVREAATAERMTRLVKRGVSPGLASVIAQGPAGLVRLGDGIWIRCDGDLTTSEHLTKVVNNSTTDPTSPEAPMTLTLVREDAQPKNPFHVEALEIKAGRLYATAIRRFHSPEVAFQALFVDDDQDDNRFEVANDTVGPRNETYAGTRSDSDVWVTLASFMRGLLGLPN